MGAEQVYSFHLEDVADASQAGSLRLHGIRSWTCSAPKNGTVPFASGLPPGHAPPLCICLPWPQHAIHQHVRGLAATQRQAGFAVVQPEAAAVSTGGPEGAVVEQLRPQSPDLHPAVPGLAEELAALQSTTPRAGLGLLPTYLLGKVHLAPLPSRWAVLDA